jgi:hypothetical protein
MRVVYACAVVMHFHKPEQLGDWKKFVKTHMGADYPDMLKRPSDNRLPGTRFLW